MAIRSMKITMVVDGEEVLTERAVEFTFNNPEKLDEMTRDSGSLGSTLRALLDAIPRVHNVGQVVHTPKIGDVGPISIGLAGTRKVS